MKCANCGKEFGNGVNCQNCGIDRVAGLANYSGYDGHASSNGYDSSSYGGQNSSNTTVCYACGEIIPVNSTFCPVCGKKLFVTCPNCGHEYSSLYPVCNKCGTNRKEYEERKRREEEERQRKQREWEQSPEGKAELERKRKEKLKEENSTIKAKGFWGIFLLCGFVVLCAWLNNDVIDENWQNQEIIGVSYRTILHWFEAICLLRLFFYFIEYISSDD